LTDYCGKSVPPARRRRNVRARAVRVASAAVLIAAGASAIVAPASAATASATASPVVASSASPAPASPARAFFGLAPASTTKIDGRPYFNWSATPGSFLSDHVAVVNLGATPVTLRLFVSNAVNATHGSMGFKNGPDNKPPAGWITVHYPGSSQTLNLPPHSTVILPVTVVIPRSAPPGDHVGAFIASMSSVIESKNHAKIHFVQQVADRIIARIAGNLKPGLTVTGLKVDYRAPVGPFSTGTTAVSFTVANTGNEMLGGQVTVSIEGFLGSTETHKNVITVPVMLPGGSDSATVKIPGVYPEFLMNAKVSILPTVLTGQLDQGLTTYSGNQGFMAIPWALLIVLILLVLAAVGIWYRRRRKRVPTAA